MARPPIKKEKIQQMIDDGTLELLAMGADSEAEIINALNISRSRWGDYKKEFSQLSDILTRTLYEKYTMVKGANLKKALGYEYDEVEKSIVIDRYGAEHEVTRTTKKHYPPDVQAQKLAMANMVRASRKAENGGLELDWTNSVDTVEVKTEGALSLVLDDAIKNVLKELEGDR